MIEFVAEIKTRIFRILIISVFLFSIVWFYSGEVVTNILSLTNAQIMTISPLETISTELLVSTIISALLIAPYISFEAYGFASPGLSDKEKKSVKIGAASLYVSFLAGFTVLAYGFIKGALFIINGYSLVGVTQSVSEYNFVSFICMTALSCGLLACIPFVISVLTYSGIIHSSILTKYWKQAVVGSMILSAIVAPGVDIMSMMLLEIPVLLLYFVSIIVSKFIEKIKVKNIKGVKICSGQLN